MSMRAMLVELLQVEPDRQGSAACLEALRARTSGFPAYPGGPGARRSAADGGFSGIERFADGEVRRLDFHPWAFRARARANAFGLEPQPAISSRARGSRRDQEGRQERILSLLAAEGRMVLFLESRFASACSRRDSSSGATPGSAVNRATRELVPLIASAPADAKTRDAWLRACSTKLTPPTRSRTSKTLADHWRASCARRRRSRRACGRSTGRDHEERAVTRPEYARGHYHYHDDVLDGALSSGALRRDSGAPGAREVLVVQAVGGGEGARGDGQEGGGHTARRIVARVRGQARRTRCVAQVVRKKSCCRRGSWTRAFARYSVDANRAGTYLATFRSVAKKYPMKSPVEVLERLVASTPGEEGKWFAAAKDAGLLRRGPRALEEDANRPAHARSSCARSRRHGAGLRGGGGARRARLDCAGVWLREHDRGRVGGVPTREGSGRPARSRRRASHARSRDHRRVHARREPRRARPERTARRRVDPRI